MINKIYPIPDAAKELSVSRQWVYDLMNRSIIKEATADDLKGAGIDPEMLSPKRRFITEESLARYKEYRKKYQK